MEINTETQIPPQPENIIYSNPTNIDPPIETVSKKEERNFLILGIVAGLASIFTRGFGFLISLVVLFFTIKDLVKNKTSKEKIKTVVRTFIFGFFIGIIIFWTILFVSGFFFYRRM